MKKLTQILFLMVTSCAFVQASENNENYSHKSSRNNQNNPNIPNPGSVEQNRLNNLQQREEAKRKLEQEIKRLEEELAPLNKNFKIMEEMLKTLEEIKDWSRDFSSAWGNKWLSQIAEYKKSVEETNKELSKKQQKLIQLNKQWNLNYGSNLDESQGVTFGMLPSRIRDKIMFERKGMSKKELLEEYKKLGAIEGNDVNLRYPVEHVYSLGEARNLRKRDPNIQIIIPDWLLNEPSEPSESTEPSEQSNPYEPSEGIQTQREKFWLKRQRSSFN